jgi:surface polysaccharide O-acyltransferase-like enzyme
MSIAHLQPGIADRPRNLALHAASATAGRIDYLDNLRALAMLLGVFLHAAFAYAKPAQTLWLATDPESSTVIDASIWFLHLFRMSLFFLLAGYLAKVAMERKGIRRFLRDRVLRIAVPLVVFYPFLLVALTAIIMFATSYLTNPQGLMALIAQASKETGAGDQRRMPGTMHLWFLYYLMGFAFLTPVFARWSWLRWDWLFARTLLMCLFPLILVPGVMAAGVPLPAPESFIPNCWPFAFYGVFYVGGLAIARQRVVLGPPPAL